MHKVARAEVLDNYRLDLTFEDGKQGIVDLSHLAGRGVFALWNDYEAFRKVEIGQAGELVWSDRLDLCPDSLYLQATGQKPEDIFPNLKPESARA